VKKILAWGCLAVLCLTLGGCGERRYARLLVKDSDFARNDAVDVAFTYDFDDPALAELDAKWGLSGIAGEGDTQSRALNLLHWLCAHTVKGNPQSLPEGLKMNADALLAWSFDQPGNDPNCKHLAVILSECLLAVGIKAYALWCFPKVYKGDNHVVVQVWLPEESRWIMLDPSFDAYFVDDAGRILCAPEVRERLGSGAPLQLNPEGQNVAGWYFNYMAKDMYYFYHMLNTKVGMLEADRVLVFLLPAGYDPAKQGNPYYKANFFATWDSLWA
jgi:hypothetical protein